MGSFSMKVSRDAPDPEQLARAVLREIGRPPSELLRALDSATALSLDEIGTLAGRTGFTVRRWRKAKDAAVPAPAVCAIEDLRAIVAMLIEAGHSRRSVTSFLRSRNPGLGRDRPLDGLRYDVGEFARVEHVTQCFIDGIPPEQGRHVLVRATDDHSVHLVDGQRPPEPAPGGSGDPVEIDDGRPDRHPVASA
jgi:hypothetical protein